MQNKINNRYLNTSSTCNHIVIIFFILIISSATHANYVLKSPDGKVIIEFDLKDTDGRRSCPTYTVKYNDQLVIADSNLGLAIKDAAPLEAGFEIVDVSRTSHNSTYSPVYGERKIIRDDYNQLVVELKETHPPHRQLNLTFRAYNEGAALCYTLPQQDALSNFVISAEKTQFRFTSDHTAYAVYSAQGKYSKVPLSQIKNNCERPLTVEIDEDLFASIAEARLVDYARMRLCVEGVLPKGRLTAHPSNAGKMPATRYRPLTLVSSLHSEVNAVAPMTTPWRVIMLGRTPGELLERNYLLPNLNEPCAIKDTSWIKSGKVIREVTLTTAGGIACVDFAVEHNLQYVEFDAGWYGHEYSDDSDATTISVDPKRSKGSLDLHYVIEYATQRGIGIILYVNRRALERQLDDILPLYEKWGIKGVKYGFVQVGSQRWMAWLHEAVRKAAKHHLMVDIHDEYRPTGYSRTYPNLMTQEGIAGDETKPSNSLTLTILFTRMLAGAADNTICYYDRRVDDNASHAYQLAKSVCFYSPWQFLYWYDRPANVSRASRPRIAGKMPATPSGGAGGSRNIIGDEPELEFFDHVPTVWDDTKVIHGQIGEYAVMARRSGQSWFIGCMNADEPHTFDIPLDFLDKERRYTAHIYSDETAVQTRTHVKISRQDVDASSILKVELPARRGQAIRIHPTR